MLQRLLNYSLIFEVYFLSSMIKSSFTILSCLLSYIEVFGQQQLFIPDTLSGSTINLTIQNGTKQFYAGAITQTMGINGNLLAPTIILRKHQNVTMNVTNNIDDTTTIHWHGMHVAPENDSGPHITILSGAIWSPTFPILNPAGTHWYHPHLHHKTYNHVQKELLVLSLFAIHKRQQLIYQERMVLMIFRWPFKQKHLMVITKLLQQKQL